MDRAGGDLAGVIQGILAIIAYDRGVAADVLGVERSNLYRKMRAYGIEVERHGGAGAADSPDPAEAAGPATPATPATTATPATPAATAAPIIEP